jgi:hypothetical protein
VKFFEVVGVIAVLFQSPGETSPPMVYPIEDREGSRVNLKRFRECLLILLLGTGIVALVPSNSFGQDQEGGTPKAATKKDLSPEEIIKQFSAKETAFYEAWKEYTYHQVSEVQVISVNGIPKQEKMTIVSDVVFRDDGTREVQVSRRAGDLKSVIFTLQDEEVINNLQPFALTDKELPLYNLEYVGKDRIDELTCYVFSVKPKSLKGGRMYFEGRIWVDDRDLQIVRTVGKPVPQKKSTQFPDFETVRQFIDNKYWFPVWTHAASDLRFERDTIRIEETISYDKYKYFGSKATIQYGPAKP